MLAECAALHRERVAAPVTATTRRRWRAWSRASPFSGVDYTARAIRPRRRCSSGSAPRCSPRRTSWPCRPARWPRRASPTRTPAATRASSAVANRLGALVGPFNYLGLPALSLPVGLDAQRHADRAAAGGAAVRGGAAAARGARVRGGRRASPRGGRRSRPSLRLAVGRRRRPAGSAELRGILMALLAMLDVRADGRGQQIPEHALPDAADHLAALRVHIPMALLVLAPRGLGRSAALGAGRGCRCCARCCWWSRSGSSSGASGACRWPTCIRCWR